MIKNEKYNLYQKTKYQERKAKAKFVKNALTAIIIVLAVLFFWYANDVRGKTEDTTGSIQGVRDELRSLRKSVQDQFNATGQKLLDQDKKIEGVKQSKAEEKKAITLLQNQRPTANRGCNYSTRTAVGYEQADKAAVAAEIARVFGDKAKLATAVFTAESGLRSNACSSTNDWGVVQVNLTAHPQYSKDYLMDFRNNIQAAWQISNGGTRWTPWSAWKNGAYLKFI